MSTDGRDWPLRQYWIDIAWGLFAVANLVAMVRFPSWETVPFHFIWVSVTILYGFRVWKMSSTLATLAAVMVATSLFIGIDIVNHSQPLDEITEVPLMASMFFAMVWHARRRLATVEEIRRVSESNLRLLERERRFIQDASHELRTPITVALGHAELIQRTSADRLLAADVEIVTDELQRLRRLADRLLLLAAADHPDFLRATPVSLEPLVLEAARRWSPSPRHWVLGQLAEATVKADPDRIALAMDALIENAVQHTGPEDSIELSLRRGEKDAIIAVADSGCGIDPDQIDHVFDRFGRVDRDRNRGRGGVGLGLAIVRSVAEAHGGSVGVTSTPGHGCTFEISLPIAAPSASGRTEMPRGDEGIPARMARAE